MLELSFQLFFRVDSRRDNATGDIGLRVSSQLPLAA